MKASFAPPDLGPRVEPESSRPQLGGLFPLPEVHVESSSKRLSRRCSQRRARRIQLQWDINEAVRGLNWLADSSSRDQVFRPTPRQKEVLDRVEAACRSASISSEAGPLSEEAAFRELLHGNVSQYEAAGTTLASFKLERVSLPESVRASPQVAELLDSDARQYLKDPERMLRPECESDCDIVPFWDPQLRQCPRKYKSLIQKLHAIGYLAYTLNPRGRAGIFFVRKSDGVKQRLIVDARRANARFGEPPAVKLCSPEAFAKFEVTEEADYNEGISSGFSEGRHALFGGLSDIKDCFHRLQQPPWMQAYFCFDPVPASWVGLVFPMPTSLPMGCSWSLFFAQKVSEKMMSEVPSLRSSMLLQDRGLPLCIHAIENIRESKSPEANPPSQPETRSLPRGREGQFGDQPAGDPRHYVYVDNLGVFSLDQGRVKEALAQITEKFEGCGLKLHPGEIQSETIDALGCRLSGTSRIAMLKPKRFWRVKMGIRHVLRQPAVTGRTIEVILGHATYCSLLNRSLMCIFNTCYKFIRRFYSMKVPLWDTAKAELRAFAGLLPLCTSDWSRPWNSYVTASDASPYGYGVCSRHLDRNVVGTIGRLLERERFRRGPAPSARASALIDQSLNSEDPEDVACGTFLKSGWEVNSNFVEVPRHILRKVDWKIDMHGAWQHEDNILVLEGYALLKALSRVALTVHGQHIRQLMLVDNLPIALAFDRGRSRNFKVLRLIRKFSALCLSRAITCSVRWVPSEYNCADGPSRFLDPENGPEDEDSCGPKACAAEDTQKRESTQREAPTHRQGGVFSSHAAGSQCYVKAGFNRPSSFQIARDRHRTTSVQAAGDRKRGELLERECRRATRSGTKEPPVGKEAAAPAAQVSRCRPVRRSPRFELPGVAGGNNSRSEVLPQGGAAVPRLRCTLREDLEGAGHSHHRVLESPFLEGRAAAQGRKVSGSVDAQSSRVWTAGISEAPAQLAGSQGVAPALPRQLQEADAVLRVERHRRRAHQNEAGEDGAFCGARSLLVCAPIRTPAVHDSLLGATCGERSERVGTPAGHRGGQGTDEDGGVRSLGAARQCLPTTVVPCVAGGFEEAASQHSTLGLRLRRVPRVLQARQCQPVAGTQPLSNTPQRPLHRQSQELPEPARSSEARRVESSQVRPPVRESWTPFAELPVDARTHPNLLRSLRSTARGSVPWSSGSACGPVRRRCHGKFFLDIFAGAGGVAADLRHRGFRVYEYDILHGHAFDVTQPKVLFKILTAICTKQVLGVMLAPPDFSFSVARDREVVLRNKSYPCGLPPGSLKPEDRSLIAAGNSCASATLRIAIACAEHQVPFIVAHPHSSKLWALPEFQSLAALSCSQVAVIDFCAYKARWRKRTSLLLGHIDPSDAARLRSRCCSGRGGYCSFSSRRHFRLTGLGPAGLPWTLHSQPYPPPLCRDLGHLLSSVSMFR